MRKRQADGLIETALRRRVGCHVPADAAHKDIGIWIVWISAPPPWQKEYHRFAKPQAAPVLDKATESQYAAGGVDNRRPNAFGSHCNPRGKMMNRIIIGTYR